MVEHARFVHHVTVTCVLLGIMVTGARASRLLEQVRAASAANQNNERRGQRLQVNPDAYLEKFGYLSTPEVGESHDAAARGNAIREFQRMAGIEETGRIDADTEYWMRQPRCGMPDRMPYDVDPSSRPRNSDAPDSYYVPGFKWSKSDLTWRTSRYSSDLGQAAQRRAFYNAWKRWSDVTPLTFSEISGQSDLDLFFAAYEHGDGYGNSFDGQGGTLAHAFYPEHGGVHFDESETWTENTERGTNLEIVAAHEFGHALGLGHSNVEGALMKPFYQGYITDFTLGTDDIQAVQSLYGPKDRPSFTPRPTDAPGPQPTAAPDNRPDSCHTKYDAVFQGSDGDIYVLKHKWVWRLHFWGMYTGYPTLTSTILDRPPTNPNAAVYSFRTGYTYIFKNKYVYQYAGTRRVRRARIAVAGYRPPQAALMPEDGKIYLLSGRFYWLFSEQTMTVDTGLKRRVSDRFPGAPDNTEAAVRLNDGYIYFFKGHRYHKFDEHSNVMEAGYPRDSAGPWMGPMCTPDGSYVRK